MRKHVVHKRKKNAHEKSHQQGAAGHAAESTSMGKKMMSGHIITKPFACRSKRKRAKERSQHGLRRHGLLSLAQS